MASEEVEVLREYIRKVQRKHAWVAVFCALLILTIVIIGAVRLGSPRIARRNIASASVFIAIVSLGWLGVRTLNAAVDPTPNTFWRETSQRYLSEAAQTRDWVRRSADAVAWQARSINKSVVVVGCVVSAAIVTMLVLPVRQPLASRDAMRPAPTPPSPPGDAGNAVDSGLGVDVLDSLAAGTATYILNTASGLVEQGASVGTDVRGFLVDRLAGPFAESLARELGGGLGKRLIQPILPGPSQQTTNRVCMSFRAALAREFVLGFSRHTAIVQTLGAQGTSPDTVAAEIATRIGDGSCSALGEILVAIQAHSSVDEIRVPVLTTIADFVRSPPPLPDGSSATTTPDPKLTG